MNTLKRIIKTYLISVVAGQITYMLILGVGYIQSNLYPPTSADLTFSFIEYLTVSILGLAWTLPDGLVVTVILFIVSLFDERALNRWLVAGLASCFFILSSPMIENTWFQLVLILISLGVVFLFMKVQKGKTKIQS